MFLDDTACNLARINLMKFVREDGEFDVEAFRVRLPADITAQEILVDHASYPTPQDRGEQPPVPAARPGLREPGRLLMSRGPRLRLATRAAATRPRSRRSCTARRTGQSAVIARDHVGPFDELRDEREPMLRVMQMHRDAAYEHLDRRPRPSS